MGMDLGLGGMGYMGGAGMSSSSKSSSVSKNIDHQLRTQVRELERRLDRAELINRAIWDIIAKSTNLTEADLEARIKEIDMRDGVADGKITVVPLRCPTCKRVSSSKHWKCLYCGQEFEKYGY
jgi:hypothetical protein